MSRPSVRMEVQGGSEHWVVRDRGGAYVGSALPYRAGWESAMRRAGRVAAAQPSLPALPVAPAGQRSITDVGLQVWRWLNGVAELQDVTTEYYPPGRALYMLTRFGDMAKFDAGKSPLYCRVVDGVDPRTEKR